MLTVKSFIKYIKHRAGLEDATDFNLIEEYRDFFTKVKNIDLDKGIDPTKVPDIDEAAKLTDDEWKKLDEEFNKIHSAEHREALEKALSALK